MDLENAGAPAPVADAALPPPVVDAPSPAPVETKETSIDDTLLAAYRNSTRERDNNGRFKGNGATEQPATDTTVSQDQPPVAATETATPSIQAPQSWSAEVKDKWATLPPDLQAFIAKRESESHSAITRQGEQIAQYEPLGRVIDQYRGSFERDGVTPSEGIHRLLEADQRINQDPRGGIKWLCDAFGIDPHELTDGQSYGDASPETAALLQKITGLEQQVHQLSTRDQSRAASEQQAQLTATMSEIDAFAKDKPDWSELENDVFSEVLGIKATIEARITAPMSPNQILQKAYERAQRNNPAVWAKKQEAERKAEETKRIEEAKKRADQARAASQLNVRGQTANGTAAGSMDDTLKSAYRSAHSR